MTLYEVATLVAFARQRASRATSSVGRSSHSRRSSSCERERCKVDPRDASWPTHSRGITTISRLELAQLLGELGVFFLLWRPPRCGGAGPVSPAGGLATGVTAILINAPYYISFVFLHTRYNEGCLKDKLAHGC
jgi:hypothetical protein